MSRTFGMAPNNIIHLIKYINWEKYKTLQIFSIFHRTCNRFISRKRDIFINLIPLWFDASSIFKSTNLFAPIHFVGSFDLFTLSFFMNLYRDEWIKSIHLEWRTWIMGFWFGSGFINDWKSCATLNTKCIKINTRLSSRYSLIHLYWAVETISLLPLNPERVVTVLRKYSFRLSNCSVSFTITLSRKIFSSTRRIFKEKVKVNRHLIKLNNVIYFLCQFTESVVCRMNGACYQIYKGCAVLSL